MPQLTIQTKQAKQVWQSPDGQRTIFELLMESDGKEFKAKTYSREIATENWSGTVETYEKPGRNGSETFVKQPPKEDFQRPSSGSQGGYKGGSSKPMPDPFTMYLSYAKDLVVAQLAQGNKLEMDACVQLVLGSAYELYENRPEARASASPTATQETKSKDEDLLKNIDEIFPDKPEKEEKWTEPPQLPVN